VLQPGFDADVPRGADLLGIGREVEAFAMLVAGRETLTPLSIGVFATWGSGQSYFMARLQERVADIAAAGPEDAYFQRIAQVRFNAWHCFVDTYRLVKASLSDVELDSFTQQPGAREERLPVLAELTHINTAPYMLRLTLLTAKRYWRTTRRSSTAARTPSRRSPESRLPATCEQARTDPGCCVALSLVARPGVSTVCYAGFRGPLGLKCPIGACCRNGAAQCTAIGKPGAASEPPSLGRFHRYCWRCH
jgi:hypothetical protein